LEADPVRGEPAGASFIVGFQLERDLWNASKQMRSGSFDDIEIDNQQIVFHFEKSPH
jgi:hypothetical protein